MSRLALYYLVSDPVDTKTGLLRNPSQTYQLSLSIARVSSTVNRNRYSALEQKGFLQRDLFSVVGFGGRYAQ